MSSIDKISAKAKLQQKEIPIVQSSNSAAKTDNKHSNKDAFFVSPDWPKKVNWDTAVQDELETLIKSFPNINISIGEEYSKEELTKIAEELGYGAHLVISRKFLEQMKSGAEAYERGKNILKQLLSCLSKGNNSAPATGAYVDEKNIIFWNGTEKAGEMKEKLPDFDFYKSFFSQSNKKEETPGSFTDKFRQQAKAASYSVSGLYARLAGAGSKQVVQAAMSEARQNIGSLRLASSFGTSKERQKARASIAALEKLLLRGNRKIRRLTEEDLVRLREKRAIKQEEERKALQLRIEMQKRQKERHSADRAIALEGHLHDVNSAARFQKSKYGDYEYSHFAAVTVPAIPLPSAPPAGAAGISGGSAAPLEITLSAVVSF